MATVTNSALSQSVFSTLDMRKRLSSHVKTLGTVWNQLTNVKKCSNIVIKGKKSLIVPFYQLMVSFFTAEIRVLKYIIVYLISVCCLY